MGRAAAPTTSRPPPPGTPRSVFCVWELQKGGRLSWRWKLPCGRIDHRFVSAGDYLGICFGGGRRTQPAKARKSEARILTEKPIAGFRSLTGSSTIIRHPMSICEYQAKATAAMQMAAAATCESDRSDWLRVALTWQDLARVQEDELSASPQLSEQGEW